jgi:hypothetical protein
MDVWVGEHAPFRSAGDCFHSGDSHWRLVDVEHFSPLLQVLAVAEDDLVLAVAH